MADKAKAWEPLVTLFGIPLVLLCTGGLGSVLYTNTVLITQTSETAIAVSKAQPGMTRKLNRITAMLVGVQTKEDAMRQYKELRDVINGNDKRITVLENRIDRLEGS